MCCNFVMVWHLLIRAVVCSKHVVHGIGLFGGCSLLFFFLDLKHIVNEKTFFDSLQKIPGV